MVYCIRNKSNQIISTNIFNKLEILTFFLIKQKKIHLDLFRTLLAQWPKVASFIFDSFIFDAIKLGFILN